MPPLTPEEQLQADLLAFFRTTPAPDPPAAAAAAIATAIAAYHTSAGGTGDVVGPEGATAGNLPVFADATGKLIEDSGASPQDFAPASHGVDHVNGTDDVPDFVGDDGSYSGTHGLVPAPDAGDADLHKVLEADGAWHEPAAGGSTLPIFAGSLHCPGVTGWHLAGHVYLDPTTLPVGAVMTLRCEGRVSTADLAKAQGHAVLWDPVDLEEASNYLNWGLTEEFETQSDVLTVGAGAFQVKNVARLHQLWAACQRIAASGDYYFLLTNGKIDVT